MGRVIAHRIVKCKTGELEKFLREGWEIEEIIDKKAGYYLLRRDITHEKKPDFIIYVTSHARRRMSGRFGIRDRRKQDKMILEFLERGDMIVKKEKRSRIYYLLLNELVAVLAQAKERRGGNVYVVLTVVDELPFRLQQRLSSGWGISYKDNFFSGKAVEIRDPPKI